MAVAGKEQVLGGPSQMIGHMEWLQAGVWDFRAASAIWETYH